MLKDLHFPIEKVNDMIAEEFLDWKFNANLDNETEDKEQEGRINKYKEYVTEIEQKEMINRKVFQMKLQLVYGPEKRQG